MRNRRQEKIGWVGGWFGGFIWVLILSVLFFFQGKTMHTAVGLLIAFVACVVIIIFAPWKHPQVQYRMLMIPIYLLVIVAVSWGVWALGGLRQMGINSWWGLLILLPALSPLLTLGNRCWNDGET